jgi:hypothetical protein
MVCGRNTSKPSVLNIDAELKALSFDTETKINKIQGCYTMFLTVLGFLTVLVPDDMVEMKQDWVAHHEANAMSRSQVSQPFFPSSYPHSSF